jgi:hypothetical protein
MSILDREEAGVCWMLGETAPSRKTYSGDFGWPNSTDCGATMYENHAFRTEREAWAATEVELRAGVYLVGSAVRQAEADLLKAQKLAAATTRDMADFDDNRRRRFAEVGED